MEKYTFLHDRISVAQEDGGKILRMNSDGNDIYLTKEADWENVKISFDYRFDSDTKDYGGNLHLTQISEQGQPLSGKSAAAFQKRNLLSEVLKRRLLRAWGHQFHL